MLEYGDVFLEQNAEALESLKEIMTPAGFEVALEMAPCFDVEEFDEQREAA